MRLSVVVVARNEEAVIGRSLASIVQRAGPLGAEIIFVDSASDDRTIAIAREFPVTVIRLGKESLLSPSAGRFVGTKYCHGEYLLFLDGDMILCDAWLEGGLAAMQQGTLGGVSGRLLFVPPGGNLADARVDTLPVGRQATLGGGALYRRSALEACGTFNPFLKGEEERELEYRLRRSGYLLEHLDIPMAYHFDKPKTRDEVREKSSQFVGVGQVLRAYPFSRLFWELMRPNIGIFSLQIAVIAWVLAVAATALLGAFGMTGVLAAAGVVFVLLLVVLKGASKVGVFFRSRIMIFFSVARGLRAGMPDPGRYESHLEIVKMQSLSTSHS